MPPVLETKRLRLRPPNENDFDGIYRLGTNPNVMRYITGKTQSKEEAVDDLRRRMKTANMPLGYWIVELKESKEFVGWLALKQLDDTPDVEIGYRFLEEFWGKGMATEGGRRVMAYGFEEINLEKIVAVARPENAASIKVMEKLGLQFEKKGVFYKTSCVFYSISKSRYENQS